MMVRFYFHEARCTLHLTRKESAVPIDFDMSTAVVAQDPLRPITRLKRLQVGESFVAPLNEEKRWRSAAWFVNSKGRVFVAVSKSDAGICCTRTT